MGKKTDVLAIRVKMDIKATFLDGAERDSLSPAEYLEKLMENDREVAVTPHFEECEDEYGVMRIPKLLAEKGYEGRTAQRAVDNIVRQIAEAPRYNARRDSGEWGC